MGHAEATRVLRVSHRTLLKTEGSFPRVDERIVNMSPMPDTGNANFYTERRYSTCRRRNIGPNS